VSVSEISRLKVKSAQRATFIKEAHTFAKILASDHGCHHVEMLQGVEDPDSFVFVITWDSREAHKTFQGSDRGRQAISTIVSYLVEPPTTSHYKSLGLPAGNHEGAARGR
jgi:quinol monooxygenase YgiN